MDVILEIPNTYFKKLKNWHSLFSAFFKIDNCWIPFFIFFANILLLNVNLILILTWNYAYSPFKCLEQFLCVKYEECAKTVEVGLDKFKDDFFLKLMKSTLMKVSTRETSIFIPSSSSGVVIKLN